MQKRVTARDSNDLQVRVTAFAHNPIFQCQLRLPYNTLTPFMRVVESPYSTIESRWLVNNLLVTFLQMERLFKSTFGHQKMTKDKYILVTEYPITEYKCGLKAGDRVRLKKDLIVRDHRNRPTGDVHPKGEIWTVLRGSKEGRVDVWFRQADGKPHTWDDDSVSIDEWFERLGDTKKVRSG